MSGTGTEKGATAGTLDGTSWLWVVPRLLRWFPSVEGLLRRAKSTSLVSFLVSFPLGHPALSSLPLVSGVVAVKLLRTFANFVVQAWRAGWASVAAGAATRAGLRLDEARSASTRFRVRCPPSCTSACSVFGRSD